VAATTTTPGQAAAGRLLSNLPLRSPNLGEPPPPLPQGRRETDNAVVVAAVVTFLLSFLDGLRRRVEERREGDRILGS
jgi:hypothetical protein